MSTAKNTTAKNTTVPSIAGLKKEEAMGTLVAHFLTQGKPIAEALAEAKVLWEESKGQGGRGETARFYTLLETGPMNDQAFSEWLEGTTENNRNHKSQFQAIRLMANRIWASK
jgi:predicted RNase H-like HicB family nuclease